MNIEKIEVNGHYVWVDKNAEIEKGDWIYNLPNKDYVVSAFFKIPKEFGETYKIIAASPELNLEGVPTYVEWLAEQYVIEENYLPVYKEECYRAFINGYQTAEKEETPIHIHEGITNTRVYIEDGIIHVEPNIAESIQPTWDDVRKAIEMARTLVDGKNEFEVENILGSSDGTYGISQKYTEKKIIQQLKQSKQ